MSGGYFKSTWGKDFMIEYTIEGMPVTFGIADIERAYPTVSCDMIWVILNFLREEGKLACRGTGRKALWKTW